MQRLEQHQQQLERQLQQKDAEIQELKNTGHRGSRGLSRSRQRPAAPVSTPGGHGSSARDLRSRLPGAAPRRLRERRGIRRRPQAAPPVKWGS